MTAVSASPGEQVEPATRCTSEVLVERIARGDQAAFTELYDRYLPPVWNLTQHITRRQATSERVVQDLFIHVWRSASQYDPDRESVQSWVLELTQARAIDQLTSIVMARDATAAKPFQPDC